MLAITAIGMSAVPAAATAPACAGQPTNTRIAPMVMPISAAMAAPHPSHCRRWRIAPALAR